VSLIYSCYSLLSILTNGVSVLIFIGYYDNRRSFALERLLRSAAVIGRSKTVGLPGFKLLLVKDFWQLAQ
jgi:hypothetical protein